MGLKKRTKVSAEFNMSSLTDIIFLLLIFFMLTSTLVSPHSVNMKTPGTIENPSTVDSNPPRIEISRKGDFDLISADYDGGQINSKRELYLALRGLDRTNGAQKLEVIVEPERNTPVEHVVLVLDIFEKLKIEPIMVATE